MSYYQNSITNALYINLIENETIVNSSINICKDEPLNSDPNMTPWVGIYTGGTTFDPERLVGGINPWKASIEINLYLQSASYSRSGFETQDELDRLFTVVFDVINDDRKLKDTVRNIVSITNEPYLRDLDNDDAFFSNIVTIIAEVEA